MDKITEGQHNTSNQDKIINSQVGRGIISIHCNTLDATIRIWHVTVSALMAILFYNFHEAADTLQLRRRQNPYCKQYCSRA